MSFLAGLSSLASVGGEGGSKSAAGGTATQGGDSFGGSSAGGDVKSTRKGLVFNMGSVAPGGVNPYVIGAGALAGLVALGLILRKK